MFKSNLLVYKNRGIKSHSYVHLIHPSSLEWKNLRSNGERFILYYKKNLKLKILNIMLYFFLIKYF